MDLSPAVGHVRECPHSGTRYFLVLFLFWVGVDLFSGGLSFRVGWDGLGFG